MLGRLALMPISRGGCRVFSGKAKQQKSNAPTLNIPGIMPLGIFVQRQGKPRKETYESKKVKKAEASAAAAEKGSADTASAAPPTPEQAKSSSSREPKEHGELDSERFYDNRLFTYIEQWEVEQYNRAAVQNHFDQLNEWTREGKLWQFPVDNEQGMEEEARTGFHEHVFLERHLSQGFPESGPIRDFMELVCLGLAQNPRLSVAEKKAHIDWYRQYFADKAERVEEAIKASQRQAELEEAIRGPATDT